jgi:hypothetical protein
LSRRCTDKTFNKSDKEQAVGDPQQGLSTRDDDEEDDDDILVMVEGLLVVLLECVGRHCRCCCRRLKNIIAVVVEEQIFRTTIPHTLSLSLQKNMI